MTAPSETTIANLALLMVKMDPLTTLSTDTSTAGGMIRLQLPIALASLMALTPWEFAIHRATLEDPTFDDSTEPYVYHHTLPNDFSYLVAAIPKNAHANMHINRLVEAGKLLVEYPEVTITYIPNDIAIADLPDYLVPVLAGMLAQAIAWPLTGNPDAQMNAARQTASALGTAIATNAARAGGSYRVV